MFNLRSLRSNLFLFLISFGASPATAFDYTFELVAQQGDVIAGQVLGGTFLPQVDDLGNVLFFSSGGVFSATDRVVGVGSTIDGKQINTIDSLVLSDAGDVYFLGGGSFGNGIFTPTGTVVASGNSVGGLEIDTIHGFDVNESGEIVFVARFITPGSTFSTGIFSGTGLVAQLGDTIDGNEITTNIAEPRIDDSGNISFLARSAKWGVYTPSSLVIEAGDVVDGVTLGGVGGGSNFRDEYFGTHFFTATLSESVDCSRHSTPSS